MEQPEKQMQTANVLRRCKDALPAVTGALIAAAAAVVLAKSAASAKNAVNGAPTASEEAKVKKGIFFHGSTPDDPCHLLATQHPLKLQCVVAEAHAGRWHMSMYSFLATPVTTLISTAHSLGLGWHFCLTCHLYSVLRPSYQRASDQQSKALMTDTVHVGCHAFQGGPAVDRRQSLTE